MQGYRLSRYETGMGGRGCHEGRPDRNRRVSQKVIFVVEYAWLRVGWAADLSRRRHRRWCGRCSRTRARSRGGRRAAGGRGEDIREGVGIERMSKRALCISVGNKKLAMLGLGDFTS